MPQNRQKMLRRECICAIILTNIQDCIESRYMPNIANTVERDRTAGTEQ